MGSRASASRSVSSTRRTPISADATLALFDEFARTTKPGEAEALLSAILEDLAGRRSAVALFSTHFRGVRRLPGVRYLRMGGLDRSRLDLAAPEGEELADRIRRIDRQMRFCLEPDTQEERRSDAVAVARLLGLPPALARPGRRLHPRRELNSGGPMESRLHLPQERIDRARELASRIVAPVQEFIDSHTTVTVERATLRLAGADGADADGVPVPNLVVDQLSRKARRRSTQGLGERPGEDGRGRRGAEPEGRRRAPRRRPPARRPRGAGGEGGRARRRLHPTRVRGNRTLREERLARYAGKNHAPLLYVIVATGNIHEDVKQARAAAEQGADVVAVIRTTAQSLLDYVPYGATTEGFGGTYATQENFRIMRAALDEVVEQQGRYVHLTNYASGLCMPEIAAMGALERLDMMLNDSMYGILFRDINMYRTFVDQQFSRMINAFAGIIINTGEDNYLTTVRRRGEGPHRPGEPVPQRALRLCRRACAPWLMGLGHAFEMDPTIPTASCWSSPRRDGPRDLPEGPLKYMPPTKFMTGDIFRGYVQNAMFNFVSQMTGQSIQLLGMLTEAIHTPFMQDRYLALENARYVMNSMADLADGGRVPQDGAIVSRAARRARRGRRVPRGGRSADGLMEPSRRARSPTSSAPPTWRQGPGRRAEKARRTTGTPSRSTSTGELGLLRPT